MRAIEEVSIEGTYRVYGEVECRVTWLDCGHQAVGPEVVIGAAPGAPYAGPQVAVARTASPRDLQDAAERQDAIDHPHGREWDL